MVTKNIIKYVHSLALKKYRDREHAFVAEGAKVVGDLLAQWPCKWLFATVEQMERWEESGIMIRAERVEIVTQDELRKLSCLSSPATAVAVFSIPLLNNDMDELAELPKRELCLALDCVQDPGNLGTIIRIADWFGIKHIFVTRDTADPFSPKVIQATMGAVTRVRVHVLDLEAFLRSLPADIPVCGTFLHAPSIYDADIPQNGVIIMGNEGNGISPSIAEAVNKKVLIPRYRVADDEGGGVDSLNVAIATAIVCAEIRRRSAGVQLSLPQ